MWDNTLSINKVISKGWMQVTNSVTLIFIIPHNNFYRC